MSAEKTKSRLDQYIEQRHLSSQVGMFNEHELDHMLKEAYTDLFATAGAQTTREITKEKYYEKMVQRYGWKAKMAKGTLLATFDRLVLAASDDYYILPIYPSLDQIAAQVETVRKRRSSRDSCDGNSLLGKLKIGTKSVIGLLENNSSSDGSKKDVPIKSDAVHVEFTDDNGCERGYIDVNALLDAGEKEALGAIKGQDSKPSFFGSLKRSVLGSRRSSVSKSDAGRSRSRSTSRRTSVSGSRSCSRRGSTSITVEDEADADMNAVIANNAQNVHEGINVAMGARASNGKTGNAPKSQLLAVDRAVLKKGEDDDEHDSSSATQAADNSNASDEATSDLERILLSMSNPSQLHEHSIALS